MPPLNVCGYSDARASARGIFTRSSISTARFHASLRDTPMWRRTVSAICSPTVNAGSSERIACWKIMDTRAPRMSDELAFREADEVATLEVGMAGDPAPLSLDQAEDGERGDRLARTGLADEADRLARLDLERRTLDRVDPTRPARRTTR